MNNKKQLLTFVLGTTVGVIATIGASVFAAWSEPLNAPPTCPLGSIGCNTPIDTSSVRQIKTGEMGAANFLADNIVAINGLRVHGNNRQGCISGPTGTEGVIRYNNTIPGRSGILEYCNGTAWKEIRTN